jgi:hypothetical protein
MWIYSNFNKSRFHCIYKLIDLFCFDVELIPKNSVLSYERYSFKIDWSIRNEKEDYF